MTFRHDTILLAEIYLQSMRIQRQSDITSNHYSSMMMDESVYLDEERLVALDVLIREKERVAKDYNKKVKSKAFSIGNYV